MRIKDIGWNLVGLTLPLLIAVVTIPALIEKLGAEKFGLLALAWGLIGYAGVLDLGIGRAVTQMISAALGRHELTDIARLFTTGRTLSSISGAVGGGLLALATILGAAEFVKTETTPFSEIFYSMLIMAIAMPAQSISATYKGVCEAHQKYKGINILRIGLGVVNFAGPYLVSYFSTNLIYLVATLVLSRLTALFVYKKIAAASVKHYPTQASKNYCKATAAKIFRFGGWVTISSILSPIMTQADRFVIASVISAAAVSVYVLPYEIVVQTLILVGAISTVAFPALSKIVQGNIGEWLPYFKKWTFITASVMLIVLSVVFFTLPYLLPIWLGENFDERSVVVGQILCVGVLANSIASMFYALLHAKGLASLTAKIHLIEFPIFIFLLYLLVKSHGINGAALAWSFRMIFDFIALFFCYSRLKKDYANDPCVN